MANRSHKTAGRGKAGISALALLAGAGLLFWQAAVQAADYIEDRSEAAVGQALLLGGFDWAEVSADGLRVTLRGTAPSEVQRFRAVVQAGTAVDSHRISDEMDVARQEAVRAPDFSVELLRNDEGISLIGLVPTETNRQDVMSRLRGYAGSKPVTDMMESADYDAPEGWSQAFSFGMLALENLPRAKVSIKPGRVSITAIADSPAEKARLETALRRSKPKAVELVAEISAPRPVIAPFTLRFVIDGEGARFDACAADTDAAQERILKAAIEAGLGGKPGCTVGLGVPSPRWADAVVAAIAATKTLGDGSVTFSDADISLIGGAAVDQQRFDEIIGRLEQSLPEVFSLHAQKERAADAVTAPVEFSATLQPEGGVSLRGLIPDERMREAAESFARARFDTLDSSLRIDPSVPGGWTVKVIAGLEAMTEVARGKISVTPDMVRIEGVSGNRLASDRAAATLSRRLGDGARYELAIRYDERLDPLLGLPDGPQCVDRLNRAMDESEIGFEPGKSLIAGDPAPTLAALAGFMKDCADFRMEIGGHTDSQGSEGFNATLSRERAQAVLEAMRADGIDVSNLTARGYGESQPIDSNETEAGREANRRIEFRLVSETPVADRIQPAEVVSGVTSAAVIEAAEEAQAEAAQQAAPAEDAASADQVLPPEAETSEDAAGEEDWEMLPVLTPDENTPRPRPRPEDIAVPAAPEAAANN